MARTIKIKAGVLFTAGAMALAVTGMSTPGFAKPDDGERGERSQRAAPAQQQQQQAPRMNQNAQMRAQREAARSQPQPQGQPQARGNDGQRGNWRGNEGRPQPQQQVERQQQRPQGQQASPNEIRRNLPGWAGGTRNGEPVSRNNPPQGNVRVDRGGDRNNGRGDNRDRGSSWQGNNDRRDDNRDRGSSWQGNNNNRGSGWQGNNDRRADNDRWRGNGNNQNRNWDRNSWRRDNRYDWQSYRSRNRSTYQIGRYYSPYQNYSYRRVGIGFSLGSMFYGNRYWVNDPWQYRLPEVYGPYRWVRYYDDVLLVDIYSGEVVDVIYDFFW
ncbi:MULTISPECIES: RcnB family protein [unclassified Novosphingobium]|uniref:RcnB family protein n=1 Tax=unclassified Novosphingobium TaxID=2644732 RepID=UPI001F3EE214|nr:MULTISPECIES: RcnB family protein [unclassified Novosphingobium]